MDRLLTSSNLHLCLQSVVNSNDMEYGLVHSQGGPRLAVLAPRSSAGLDGFEGETSEFSDRTLLIGPLSSRNASALRSQLPWLKPRLLGLETSAGMGDRLGIATPGHVRAVRAVQGRISPIFAQQSIREMTRTGRSPQQVMSDVTWGIFEEGWQGGIGSDADHLKTTEDIDACLAAGFTLFTFDPGAFVNNVTDMASRTELEEHITKLPVHFQPKATGLLGKAFDIEGYKLFIGEADLVKAIAKYGKAIAHVEAMYEHLGRVAGTHPFEVEVSMDETEKPTSPMEHVYIASELRRLGVKWVSFAPRFVGRFEKGVDYIGDVEGFEIELAIHAAIARQLGPYKLSLHSGSDKFSLYPIFMEKTKGLAHLKTAGTSYLEALRTIAAVEKELMREIYTFALECFETDRKSYLISAQLINAPKPEKITDWPDLLNQFDMREILHVTFGSVLTEKQDGGAWRFYDRMMNILQTNRELYFHNLVNHFRRHLEPFSTIQRLI